MLIEKSGKWIFFAVILFFCNNPLYGQELQDSVTTEGVRDTVGIRVLDEDEWIMSDTTALAESYTVELFRKHSPAKAAMMSAVLPGLGQIYNGKAWKVPVVYAAIGISTYIFLLYQNEFLKFRKAYIDFYDGDDFTNYYLTLGLPSTIDMGEALTRGKDTYRRWRDWSFIAIVASYALNIIEANVDAHFMDYNIDDNISLHIKPCFWQNGIYSQKIGLTLCLTF